MVKEVKAKNADELSNLSFCKVIEPNRGYFYEITKAGEKRKLMVDTVSVLGVGGTYGMTEKNASSGNIQTTEICSLSEHAERLRLEITARVNGLKAGIPNICNSRETYRKLTAIYNKYCEAGGITLLSQLYFARIAEGSFLFRNNVGYDRLVTVEAINFSTGEKRVFKFNKANYLDDKNHANPVTDPDVIAMAKFCEPGFYRQVIGLDIAAELTIGRGQEVYPSQEMTINDSKNAVCRVYAKTPEGHALLHSQKFGNAIRSVDFWHGDDEFGAIAVEAYASVIARSVALRYNKGSAYSYLESIHAAPAGEWGVFEELKGASSLDEINKINDLHYFNAMLIRGGVFSLKNGKDEKNDKKDDS